MGEGDGCANPFSFRIVDRTTHEDLVFGNNAVYNRDSVYLTVNLPGYLGAMSWADSNKFNSSLLIPLDTFFLRISSSDTDTLLMSYDFVKTKCCKMMTGFGRLTGIRYNGRAAAKQGPVYLFEK